MAAPVVTKIRVTLVRTRPRDTIGNLPAVIIRAEPAPAPGVAVTDSLRVYLTRMRIKRPRGTIAKIRRPIVVSAGAAPSAARVFVKAVRARPRRTTYTLRPPARVTTPAPVLQRTVRTRITLTRTRPRRTTYRLFRPAVVDPFVPPTPTTVVTTRVQTTLGCGEYACYVMLRGGNTFVGEVPWTSLQWGRTLDDTSSASVTAQVGLCSEVMSAARSWRHELVIFRSGELVWAGPIYQIIGDPDSPQIVARDLSAWWDRRVIHETHDYLDPGTDLATIFQEIHDDAMAPDNSMGFVIETSPTGIIGHQQVFADQRTGAGSFLRDLSQEGLDWTIIGRTGHAGGKAISGGAIANILRDEHFVSPPRTTDDGSTKANREIVQGNGSDDDGLPIEGIAADTDAQHTDGLLEIVESISTIFDNTTALASAQTKLAINLEPFTIDSAVLAPTAPVIIEDLVPGRLVNFVLEETVVHVNGQVRLQSVDVTADANGEAVSITCQPLGTT